MSPICHHCHHGPVPSDLKGQAEYKNLTTGQVAAGGTDLVVMHASDAFLNAHKLKMNKSPCRT